MLNDPTITGSGFHTIEIGAIRNTYFLQHQQSNQLSSLIIRFVSFGTTTFSPPPLESPFFPSCFKTAPLLPLKRFQTALRVALGKNRKPFVIYPEASGIVFIIKTDSPGPVNNKIKLILQSACERERPFHPPTVLPSWTSFLSLDGRVELYLVGILFSHLICIFENIT